MLTQHSKYESFVTFSEADNPSQCGRISQVWDWSYHTCALLVCLCMCLTASSESRKKLCSYEILLNNLSLWYPKGKYPNIFVVPVDYEIKNDYIEILKQRNIRAHVHVRTYVRIQLQQSQYSTGRSTCSRVDHDLAAYLSHDQFCRLQL